MASLLLRRRPSTVSSHLLRRFSTLPDVDTSSTPTAAPGPAPAAPASIIDLELALCVQIDPARVHSLVASAMSSPDFHRLHTSRPLFSLSVSRLDHLRHPDLATYLLDLLLASSPGLLTRALSLYLGPDDALRAFSSSEPSAHSDVSLSTLFSTLLHAGRLDDLKSTFKFAESSFGVVPGCASHNLLLHALVKNSDLPVARKMLDEMAKKKLKHRPSPDIISYNTVLFGFSAQDDDEGFEKLLKEIYVRGGRNHRRRLRRR